MRRFFFDPAKVIDGAVALSDKESRHAISVLRLKAGAAVELLDGKGKIFTGVIITAEKGRVTVSLNLSQGEKTGDERKLPVEITLGISVIKPERMEILVQKCAELGVSRIVPLVSRRCVIKLPQARWDVKVERWRKIAQETCKQCGLSQIPLIDPVQNFDLYLKKEGADFDQILIPTLATQTKEIGALLPKLKTSKRILALVGPEGDFSAEEVALAIEKGAEAVTLGPLVLRSETAGIYILSILNFISTNRLTN